MVLAGTAYYILVRALIRAHGNQSMIATAIGRDIKGKISPLLYAIAIPLAFYDPRYSCAIYVFVAIIWLVPDKRIERMYESRD
jgi:uncharacterized membrane protein